MSRTAVVIGAGVGGMASALRLKNQGFDVHLFEATHKVGGKLARYERDGYVFDLGPSLFTIPAVYRDLFLKTGEPLESEVDLIPLDPAFRYIWPDGTTLSMPGVSTQACANAIGEIFGEQSRNEWRAFMNRASDMWSLTRQSVMMSAISSVSDMASALKSPRDILTIAPFMSLRALADRTFTDKRLVSLVDRYATYTGSDSRKAPAVLATVPYVEQEFGAWHIGGGLTELGHALERRLRSRGVHLHLNSPVQSINVDNNRVSGITTHSGQKISAEVVVANADAHIVYNELLPQSVGKKGRQRVTKSPRSLSGFVLLLALKGTTPGVHHHNVWLTSDYDAEFDDIFERHQPIENPTIYACVPDDDAMRPDADSESWFVLINAPRHSAQGESGSFNWTPEASERYARKIVAMLEERGIDVSSRLQWMEWRSPADLEQATLAPGGAIYGTASHGPRSTFLRAANRSEIQGLYLVGGSAHPGGGLPLVGMSAEITAELIRKDFPRSGV